MTTALILGASGFCARHLARALRQTDDATVIGADVMPEPPEQGLYDRYWAVDIGDADSVSRLLEDSRPDWVFNLVGVARGSDEDIYRANLLGTVHLLEAVRMHAPDARVALVGSAAEYGMVDESALPITEDRVCNPVGSYGISKYAATMAATSYAHRHGIKVVIARPFNIVGPGIGPGLVVGAILRRAKEALATQSQPAIKVGNLDTKRDFVAVEDVVDGLMAMIRGEHFGEIFNICSGEPRPIREVIELALSHAPRPIRLEVDPGLVRSGDVKVIYGSYEKANRAFGFRPAVSLEDSLEAAWRHEVGGYE